METTGWAQKEQSRGSPGMKSQSGVEARGQIPLVRLGFPNNTIWMETECEFTIAW